MPLKTLGPLGENDYGEEGVTIKIFIIGKSESDYKIGKLKSEWEVAWPGSASVAAEATLLDGTPVTGEFHYEKYEEPEQLSALLDHVWDYQTFYPDDKENIPNIRKCDEYPDLELDEILTKEGLENSGIKKAHPDLDLDKIHFPS